MKEKDYNKDLEVDSRIGIETDLSDTGWGMCTGFIWLRIETYGRLLCTM
jgi:hypothetical protein